ncbi:MAG: rhodanese-like domain-containing protein [Pseudomonadota bacterium]
MQFVLDNIWPIFIAVLSGAMLVWSMIGNRLRGINEVDVNGALQLINHKGAIILDVRQPEEFKSGHVLNARAIPLGELEKRIGELEKFRDAPMVVVCRSGQRSSNASALLVKQGFKQVYNMAGGMMAWQKASLPVERK